MVACNPSDLFERQVEQSGAKMGDWTKKKPRSDAQSMIKDHKNYDLRGTNHGTQSKSKLDS